MEQSATHVLLKLDCMLYNHRGQFKYVKVETKDNCTHLLILIYKRKDKAIEENNIYIDYLYLHKSYLSYSNYSYNL